MHKFSGDIGVIQICAKSVKIGMYYDWALELWLNKDEEKQWQKMIKHEKMMKLTETLNYKRQHHT